MNNSWRFMWAGLAAAALGLEAAAPKADFSKVPGVVIDHSPAESGLYIGSPSLAVLPNGDYVASHDFFGPKSNEHQSARSVVFRSADRGRTWKKAAEIQGAFWSSLFAHRGALYLLGPDRHHGNILIRRSTDGGDTWTTPATAKTGLLRDNGEYHCAPMPVIEHQGRLWRAFEWRNPPIAWGINYRAGMLSAPADADLLDAASWTASDFLPSSRLWNGGDMGAWLEGNAVATRDGRVLDILRVQTRSPDEKAAIVSISADGKTAAFDPLKGFINFPGGAKKFAIRYDRQSDLYWSLASIVHERHRAPNPGSIRNTLALTCSKDLTNWTVRCIVLYHPDVKKHGFQYVDWLFDGDDLIAACRTAYDDGLGGARNNHDANFLTFHRIANFRAKTMADSVPMPETAQLREETEDLIVLGHGWSWRKLADDEKAFANRAYVWKEVPAKFRGWRCTQTSGGEAAAVTVHAKHDGTLYFATTPAQMKNNPGGWTEVEGSAFYYTDGGKTKMSVFSRPVKSGEEVFIPQGGWTGGLLLAPPAP